MLPEVIPSSPPPLFLRVRVRWEIDEVS
uniref:Uncharacterized protein n=1 Tax=Arundo donax TaxID=35708 RepID=A0A0A8YEK9_ARUDO